MTATEKLRKAMIQMIAQAAFIRMRCGKENAELWEDAGKIVETGKAALAELKAEGLSEGPPSAEGVSPPNPPYVGRRA